MDNSRFKVRGINKETNEWVYGFYAEHILYHVTYNSDTGCNYSGSEQRKADSIIMHWNTRTTSHHLMSKEYVKQAIIIPETLGQFSGLYDCDGKEIWEGDIIDYKGFGRYLVEFCEGAFRTECIEMTALESFMFNTSFLIDSVNGDLKNPHVKVIGNRFDNNELLENKK